MKKQLLFLLLAVFTGVSFWLVQNLEKTLNPVQKQHPTRQIATAYQINGRYYDTDNNLLYALDSDAVSEYSNHAGSRFSNPKMRAFDPSRTLVWQARADKAHLSNDKNHLTLAQHVQLVKSPHSDRRLTVNAEKLLYDAEKYLLSSDHSVTLSSQAATQTVGSLVLHTRRQTADFDGGVSASYRAISKTAKQP